MSRSIARIASVTALAVVAALFAATALADNGNGKDNGNGGNSATAPGQVKPAGEPAQPQAAPQPPASQSQASPPAAQSSTAPGIKPSNSTQHSTKCTTGGGTGTSATCTSSNPKTTNADASKRYGNGKTAAQIANSHGAPAGTTLSGPGNSQPHKVAVCPGKTNKSGGKDVHAVKSYSTAECAPPKSSPAVEAPVSNSAANSASSNSASSNSASSNSASSNSASTQSASIQSVAVVSENTAAANSAHHNVAARRSHPSAESGVLGAIKALPSPSAHHANAGILGKLAPLGGNLPFSGFPLWAALLVAIALLTVGLAVRRRAATH